MENTQDIIKRLNHHLRLSPVEFPGISEELLLAQANVTRFQNIPQCFKIKSTLKSISKKKQKYFVEWPSTVL